ncbi:right-handed parallel beta-helix repeat-containing protein [Cellulomonas sp. URHB0016]
MRVPAVLSCFAVVTVAVLVASPAEARSPLTCGSTLTVSTSLREDLTCPAPGPALVLTAGVDLNLAGHTVRGPGSGVGIGVPVFGTVTIRNGTLAGWGAGVQTVGSDDRGSEGDVSVDNVTFDGNGTGLDASGDIGQGHYGKHHVVTRSRFTHNGYGMAAQWFTNVDVSRTRLSDNDVAVVVDSSGLTLADSVVERSGDGIKVVEGNADVQRTKFYDNDRALSLRFMSSATVADSVFKGSDVAVQGAGYVNTFTLTGNTFADNTTAVSFDESSGTLTGNTFRTNGVGFLSVAPPSDQTAVLQDNVFRLNGDGIRIETGDGQTSLGGNTAISNTGWGIYAPGVVDLGGNTARANGSSPQCVGVVCPTRRS